MAISPIKRHMAWIRSRPSFRQRRTSAASSRRWDRWCSRGRTIVVTSFIDRCSMVTIDQLRPETLRVPEPHPRYVGNAYALAKFRRYVDELRRYSVYFNPTLRSPMPRARGEPMMCGVVTVSARNHDVDRFIENGVDGFYADRCGRIAISTVFPAPQSRRDPTHRTLQAASKGDEGISHRALSFGLESLACSNCLTVRRSGNCHKRSTVGTDPSRFLWSIRSRSGTRYMNDRRIASSSRSFLVCRRSLPGEPAPRAAFFQGILGA